MPPPQSLEHADQAPHSETGHVLLHGVETVVHVSFCVAGSHSCPGMMLAVRDRVRDRVPVELPHGALLTVASATRHASHVAKQRDNDATMVWHG
jgi:hypothetical protein